MPNTNSKEVITEEPNDKTDKKRHSYLTRLVLWLFKSFSSEDVRDELEEGEAFGVEDSGAVSRRRSSGM